jgi:hypothetical protein
MSDEIKEVVESPPLTYSKYKKKVCQSRALGSWSLDDLTKRLNKLTDLNMHTGYRDKALQEHAAAREKWLGKLPTNKQPPKNIPFIPNRSVKKTIIHGQENKPVDSLKERLVKERQSKVKTPYERAKESVCEEVKEEPQNFMFWKVISGNWISLHSLVL